MRLLVLAAIIWPAMVTYGMSDPVLPPKNCDDFTFPDSVKNKTVAMVHQEYKNYTQQHNMTISSCNETTAFDLLSFAFNTIGNETETAKALGLDGRVQCMKYLKFTLKEIALQNLRDPTTFPGPKVTMFQLYEMQINDTTYKILQNVENVTSTLTKRGVMVNHTIHQLIQEGHFNDQSKFFLMLCFAINASDFDDTANQLLFKKELLNITMTEMADRLFTDVRTFQKDLSLKCAIRHLHSAMHWLKKLHDFLKQQRMAYMNQTVDALFEEKGLTKTNTTVFALLKAIFTTDHLTFLQFFGARSVDLNVLEFTASHLEMITFVNADVIFNYTLKELFGFTFMHTHIVLQYRMNVVLSKSRHELILKRYNVTMNDVMTKFNLTDDMIMALTEVQFENHVIRCFLVKYAESQNITLAELEARSNISSGALSNTTVFNFVDLLFKIGKANILRHIKEQRSLDGIIVDLSGLMFEDLRLQIIKEWQPLSLNTTGLSMLSISYLIFRKRVDPTRMYNMSFYYFLNSYMNPPFLSFNQLVKMYSFEEHSSRLEMEFRKYTFQEFCRFAGLKKYEIYTWSLKYFFTFISNKIINNVNECNTNPCAQIVGVKCSDHPFGFTCKCPADKNLDANKMCADIDECKEKTTPPCRNNSHCVNTMGSYECRCNKGFEDKNGACSDINECERDAFICFGGVNVNCTNTIGSFSCDCNRGFRFHPIYRICLDINECQEQQPCAGIQNSVCMNNRGSYECLCPRGYKPVMKGPTLISCEDIDECSNSTLNDCHEHATCTNTSGSYTCKCKEGYMGDGRQCKARKLFEVDPSKEKFIPKHGKIYLPFEIMYGEKKHNKLYISTNGFISIGKRYRKSSPKMLTDLNKDLWAVFWASTSLRFDSSVKYCELLDGDSSSAPLLDKVNKFIANSTKEEGFQATWAMIVTWRNMYPYWWLSFLFFFYRGETNTFQAVVATNGSTTVVTYLYEDGGMKWFTLGRRAAVGYANKHTRNGKQLDISFTPEIFDIDQKTYTDPAGNDRKGCLVYVFKPPTVVEPTPEEKCLNWIIKESRRDNEWIDSLPECPCYQNAIQEDPRFALLTSRDGAACYIMRTPKKRPKKSCCYDENGALLLSPDPNAGRAISRYADADVQAFTWCCLESTEGCQNFFQLRPSDKSCSEPEEQEQEEEEQQCTCRWQIGIRKRKRRRRRRRPVRRSWMFGDPHITTLDGFKYSFNGLGDFVMLQTKDRSTVVHARTQRPTVEGKLSNATIFSGFAFHSSMNSSVQVLFDKNMDGNISITTHSQPNNCSNFGFSAAEGKELDGFLFKKVNNTLIVLFDSGLAAEITAGMELLQISFSIPVNDVFNNKTEGLLGLLNEDMNDDLMYPNGTTISTNSSDKAMFYYGLEWKVPSDKAIFMNATTCVKQNVYFDSSFTPVFLSDLNTTQAEAFCGGNKECMLDFFATGSPQFARATRIYDENNERIKKIFDNRPPTITVTPKEVHATAGEEFTVMIKSDDPDKDTVSLSVSGLPQGASFNASTGKFIWTPPAGLMKMNIKFIARDDKNASSSYILPLRYCDCKNISSGNQCNFNLTQKTYANTSLHLVECNCTERFTGEQCETEVDPCGDSPCYENITCTATKNPFGYKCGPCPKGMDGDGKVCNDFDECRNASYNNCTAAEKCVNTIGSYRCDCKQGYKRNDASNKCEDVNECEQQFLVKKCKDNSNCVNTPGDYNCTCKPGYKGDPLKGCTDIDECLGDDQVCYGVNCNNTPGSFKCTCNPGYQIEKQADGKWICKDIDECEYPVNNNCDQVCKNIPGSFLCSCKQGFVLKDDKHSCSIASDSKCDSTKGGCMHTCTNSTGNVTCHCNKGYKLAKDGKACQDVNECSNGNGGCSNETGGCNNTAGSYNCYCNRGYSLQGNKRTCADVNECQNDNGGCKCARQGRCKAECVNDEGGSHCACKKGYKLMNADNKTCEDLNECESEPNICSVNRLCTNVDGGYYCSCKDRRMFSDGKKKCKRSKRYKFSMRLLKITGTTLQWFNDYENEYSEKSQQLKRQIVDFLGIFFRKIFGVRYMGCRVVGRFRRGSVLANVSVNFDAESNVTASEVNTAVQGQDKFDGLEVDPKASAVSDIDECSDPTLNGCHEHATCTNEPGTFSCSCKTGYQGDGFDCSAAPKKTDDGDDDNKKLMIILLCTLIPLAIIIIILIVWCCVRRLVSRSKKGNLYVDEGHQMSSSNIYNSRSNDRGEVYYGNENGRRGSEDSTTQGGTYDIATANYYDNVTVTSENGSKEAAL